MPSAKINGAVIRAICCANNRIDARPPTCAACETIDNVDSPDENAILLFNEEP